MVERQAQTVRIQPEVAQAGGQAPVAGCELAKVSSSGDFRVRLEETPHSSIKDIVLQLLYQ